MVPTTAKIKVEKAIKYQFAVTGISGALTIFDASFVIPDNSPSVPAINKFALNPAVVPA